MQRYLGIPDLKYDKAQLLETLRVNRDRHILKYRETNAGFLKQLKAALEAKLDAIKNGETEVTAKIELTEPECFAQHYDRAIAMLERTSESSIQLSQQVFEQLVLDQWEWAEYFAALNSTYTGQPGPRRRKF